MSLLRVANVAETGLSCVCITFVRSSSDLSFVDREHTMSMWMLLDALLLVLSPLDARMVRIRIKPDMDKSDVLPRKSTWTARRPATRQDHVILAQCATTCIAFLISVIPRTTLFVVSPVGNHAPVVVGPYRHWADTGCDRLWAGRGGLSADLLQPLACE